MLSITYRKQDDIMVFPPGTILQRMYFKERLRQLQQGKFIEIGVGQGYLSKLLLDQGWVGTGFDLNSEVISALNKLLQTELKQKRFVFFHKDFLQTEHHEKADLIISSMVLEHLDETAEVDYFKKCLSMLSEKGKVALFLPACPEYWGIEDEIAGHYRRYTQDSLHQLMDKVGFSIQHIAGLTYPVSNFLFKFSEALVKRSEGGNKDLAILERTKLSGNREVLFKTKFPGFLKLLLNEWMLYPLHLLQKLNKKNPRSMVIYVECTPKNYT